MIEFGVEGIFGRKTLGGKVFYLIKWQNYPSSQNSWEPAENLNGCEELIENFDKQQVRRILGARRTQDDRIEYLIEYRDTWPNRVVSSASTIQNWPILLLEFLEKHIKMVGDKRRVIFDKVEETLNIPGEPIRVTYATKVTGQLNYWFEWPQQKGRFFTNEGSVFQKIQFLEQHLCEDDTNNQITQLLTDKSECYFKKTCGDYVIGVQMITRSGAAALTTLTKLNLERCFNEKIYSLSIFRHFYYKLKQ